MATNVTVDTSVIVKALVPPRRKKQDKLFDLQRELHLSCRDVLLKTESGEYANHIPLLALIETACVVSRLSDAQRAGLALTFLGQNSRFYGDAYLMERSIRIGMRTKASGFDVVFMACAEETGSILITDDRKMYDRANDYGLDVIFIRDV
ncbi:MULTISPECIES: type II toxin-antitoxin system VapC family toxin [Methanothrix]|jgi:predicted nucleic acid-binding protein|uniref:type II toxin-antitoxin system VapC family toxin n=1 Tax=Methanothrix TaxID=2222 RepID=UPI00064E4258|nr:MULTISPECIES: type II toxin-antitoxin system VapC family toxin [Methanothrix]